MAAIAESLTTQADGAASGIMFGRFMLPDMTEHACQVSGLSLDGAVFHSAHVPPGGQQIVAYLDGVGRVEAISAEPVADGFRVMFAAGGPRRDRLDNRLKAVFGNDPGAVNRRHARFEPKDAKSQIALPDGRVYPCEVLDISLSGAGVKVDVLPSLGTYVMFGKMRGRIVRYIEAGVAIEFVESLDRAQLSEQVR